MVIGVSALYIYTCTYTRGVVFVCVCVLYGVVVGITGSYSRVGANSTSGTAMAIPVSEALSGSVSRLGLHVCMRPTINHCAGL